MSKKMVRESKAAVLARIDALQKMTDEALLAEVKRAWPQITEATREEQILFLTKDCIDRAFPDHLLR